MNLFFLILLALAPCTAITIYIYFKDKYEPEPLRLLLISILLGAISFVITLTVDQLIYSVVTLDSNSLFHQAIRAFVIVGLVEESSKFLFVRTLLYPHKEFDEPFDGIVYSVMVGMGFATVENLIFVINGGGGTGLVRMFSAIPAHGMFAVLMGFFLGRAKFISKHEKLNIFFGWGVAVIFHGIYDYFLFISFVAGIWVMAIVSLVIAYVLSRISIKLHQQASPFKEESDLENIKSKKTEPE